MAALTPGDDPNVAATPTQLLSNARHAGHSRTYSGQSGDSSSNTQSSSAVAIHGQSVGIPITLPVVFQMVGMMSLMLMAMYTFSDSLHWLDMYMYFILMPDVLVEFFEPLLEKTIPDARIRLPALWALACSAVYFWYQRR